MASEVKVRQIIHFSETIRIVGYLVKERYRVVDSTGNTLNERKFFDAFVRIFQAAALGDLTKCKDVVENESFSDVDAYSVGKFIDGKSRLDYISPRQIAEQRGHKNITEYFTAKFGADPNSTARRSTSNKSSSRQKFSTSLSSSLSTLTPLSSSRSSPSRQRSSTSLNSSQNSSSGLSILTPLSSTEGSPLRQRSSTSLNSSQNSSPNLSILTPLSSSEGSSLRPRSLTLLSSSQSSSSNLSILTPLSSIEGGSLRPRSSLSLSPSQSSSSSLSISTPLRLNRSISLRLRSSSSLSSSQNSSMASNSSQNMRYNLKVVEGDERYQSHKTVFLQYLADGIDMEVLLDTIRLRILSTYSFGEREEITSLIEKFNPNQMVEFLNTHCEKNFTSNSVHDEDNRMLLCAYRDGLNQKLLRGLVEEPKNQPKSMVTPTLEISTEKMVKEAKKFIEIYGCIFFGEGNGSLFDAFDNNYSASLEFRGVDYFSATAAYEAQKFSNHPELMVQFTKMNANEAVIFSAENYLKEDPEWDQKQEETMLRVLRAKFEKNPTLERLLLTTSNAYLSYYTGNKDGDSFWSDDPDGSGKNHLGRLLMVLRKEYGHVHGQVPKPSDYEQLVVKKGN